MSLPDSKQTESKWFRSIRANLLKWFETSQRDLPWRQTHDPYSIWISEIMLQQTQVVTVLPYYYRFLERFPTVRELAAATEADLLQYWQGLGYYRRARQMHAAAKQIVDQHGGLFPVDFEDVLALPGIGRYTAGAICSFAYDATTPIVEANTQRLYARLIAWDKPLVERSSQDRLWKFASDILPDGAGSRTVNYAAMELGSLVCKPQPDCPSCPIMKLCPTARDGLQANIPAPKAKTIYSDRYEVALLLEDSLPDTSTNKYENGPRHFLVRQCGPNEWWTGLWDFPRVEVDQHTFQSLDLPLFTAKSPTTQSIVAENCADYSTEIAKLFRDRFQLEIELHGSALRTIKHSVTRYRIQLRVCAASIASKKMDNKIKTLPASSIGSEGDEFRWVTLEDLEELPLSASARKVCQGMAR